MQQSMLSCFHTHSLSDFIILNNIKVRKVLSIVDVIIRVENWARGWNRRRLNNKIVSFYLFLYSFVNLLNLIS